MMKVIAMILALSLLTAGLAGSTVAQDVTTITKSVSMAEAELGEWVEVTLEVNAEQAPVTVTDTLPDGLSYIPGTFQIDSVDVVPDTDGNSISYELAAVGTYTITFSAQVTSVEGVSVVVTNEVEVANTTDVLASDSTDITLLPYDGFTKLFTMVYEDIPDGNVTVGELVQGNMTITFTNSFGWPITDATISDNLGAEWGIAGDGIDNDRDGTADDGDAGDLSDAYNIIPVGSDLGLRLTGKSNKVHLKVSGVDVDSGNSALCVLGVFTDYNPGKGKTPGIHSYSSPGTYEINSGAVVKFTDPDPDGPGFQFSAHTPSIEITVYEAE
jgi:uncharacterized repeat protein (TIGR01451 family)